MYLWESNVKKHNEGRQQVNRKSKIVFGAIVLIVAVAIVLVIVLKKNAKVFVEGENLMNVVEQNNSEKLQLTCLVDSQQEAEEIAEAYGIEFIRFDYGVAEFQSDKSYDELTEYGKKNGLKQLSINHEQHILKE